MKIRNELKKILALLIAVMILSIPLTSFAVNTVSVNYDTEAGALHVTGTLDVTRAGADLVFRFKSFSNSDIFLDTTTTKFDSEGNVVYEFDPILVPTSLESGVYTVEISGEDTNPPITDTFIFNGPDIVRVVLLAIKTAQTTKTVGDELLKSTSGIPNADVLGINLTEYNSFGLVGKAAFEEIMNDATYVLPDGHTDPDDKNAIQQQLSKFVSEFKQGIASGLFAEANDAQKVKSWLDTNYEVFGFNANVEITAVLNATKTDQDFINRIISKTEPMTIEQIKDYLYRSALLSTIRHKTASDTQNIIFNFPTYFAGVNTGAFTTSLNSVEQADVIGAISGNSYATCEMVVEEINRLINERLASAGGNNNFGGGGSSGGGSGIGGGGVHISPRPSVDDREEMIEKSEVFTDISNVEWAKEAIKYLYEHNIINGKAEGIYAPHDNVTRAEFIKMIAVAMGISGDITKTPFKDVSSDSWYAPYVAGAYNAGLVFGDENGCFNPEAKITRQDIATILFRANDVVSDGEIKPMKFTDQNTISDYAKEAVSLFASRGIINGFEDGRFGALEYANRAQTAVMLYRVMTIKL